MNDPIIFERVYDAPRTTLWQALTNPGEMRKWYFDIPEFRPVPGAEFSFMGGDDTQQFRHLCRVTEVVAGEKLAHTWRYEGYPGDTLLTWELFDEGENNTRLRLTHSGLETITGGHPMFARENFVKGWTYFTEDALPKYIDEQQKQS